MLIVMYRGVTPGIIPNPLATLSYGTYMLNKGFAIAASNYGEKGLCVQAGVNSSYELTKHIIENFDVTGRVFLNGASLGGCVSLLLGAKYPEFYSGVLDLFGPKDLKEWYIRVTRWANLSDAELEAEMTALGITTIPPPTFTTLEDFRNRCKNSSLAHERETSGTPATHPQEYEDRSPTYHANITIPVITVHGTDDAIVPHNESLDYQTAVENAGCSHLYRLYTVTGGGHNGGTVDEALECFIELVAWSNNLTGASSWPMFRNNLQNSGYSTSNAPNTNQTQWNYTTGGMEVFSSPAIANGKVYVGADDNKLHCVDAATGAPIWNYTTGNELRNTAAIVEGRVYIGSEDNNVYCFDAVTGEKIWNYTIGGWANTPAVAYGRVYVGSHDNNLYCLDAVTGEKIWNYTTGGYLLYPAVADSKVYVGSWDGNLYCFDALTGAFNWSYTTGGPIVGSPAVANGVVYIGSADRHVYAFSPYPAIPESFTVAVVVLSLTVAVIVNFWLLRRRPKLKNALSEKT